MDFVCFVVVIDLSHFAQKVPFYKGHQSLNKAAVMKWLH